MNWMDAPGVLNAALANVPKPAAELYHKGVEAAHKNGNERAAEELETYLKLTPPAPDAGRLRATVKDLRARE